MSICFFHRELSLNLKISKKHVLLHFFSTAVDQHFIFYTLNKDHKKKKIKEIYALKNVDVLKKKTEEKNLFHRHHILWIYNI